MISNIIAKNIYAKYTSMGNLVKSLDVFETTELKVKELCKIDGVGKEKAMSIIKNIFNEN
jgi:endonuclease III-like uncharacterized protein